MFYVPARFRQQRIVVVGDTMIDKSIKSGRSYYHQGEGLVISIYSEANFPGGAGNVAANISSLGGEAVHESETFWGRQPATAVDLQVC
jgi:bifunctional ADP-heptose synthase (sugar kinase/adenylyltransferase)